MKFRDILPLFAVVVSSYGGLTITSQPDSAQLFENDLYIGTTPAIILDTAATSHKLTLKKNGYRDTTFFAVGSSVVEKSVQIALRSEQEHSGIVLNVKARHPHAQIFVNDSLRGTDSARIADLTPGKHVLKIEGYNIKPIVDTVQLAIDERMTYIAPSIKQHFSLVGMNYSRDFTSFDFSASPVILDSVPFVLNHTGSTRGQRDFALYFGSSDDQDNRGVHVFFHVPHSDTFVVYAPGMRDSLRVKTQVAGGGILREYLYTVAAIPKIAQIDLGMLWGVYAKVHHYRYRSAKNFGGYDRFTLKNPDYVAVAPVRGYASLGGVQIRALAGYSHVFMALNYQFLPSIAFDGIDGYPDEPVSFLPVHRLSIGLIGRF